MRNKKLLLSSVALFSITATIFYLNNSTQNIEGLYQQKNGVLADEYSSDDMREWLRSKMIDVNTGEVITSEELRKIMSMHASKPKAITVEWKEHGPDNVGGRTRALWVDRSSNAVIWAGGVSGGLFKSENYANNWSRVSSFPGNQFISSIAQDASGNVYVATGSTNESWDGNGLYVSPDGGETWELVPGTSAFSTINRVVGSPLNNTILFTTTSGLRSYNYGDASVSTVPGYGGTGTKVVAISSDGHIVVVGATNNRTWVSTDGGVNFTDRSGSGAGQISSSGYTRIEYAVSKLKADGTYNIYAATTSSNNQGQWVSNDSGTTWEKHTASTPAGTTNGVIDYRDQGTYNSVVTFDPTDPSRAIIGGIDLHDWKQTLTNPAAGGWNKLSIWSANKQSDFYVHADNHALTWSGNDILYIGNDGGIGKSLDLANTFVHASRGYNTIQFYKIGYDRNGAVIGGAQDNGTSYNDHSGGSYQEFKEVTGGDGFSTVISFFNPNVIFTSSQYNSVRRSGAGGENFTNIASDNGQLFTSFLPQFPGTYGGVGDGGGAHPFHTMIFLGEYYDLNSEDSVTFIPQKSYDAGETVMIPSLATGDTIAYVTPTAITYDDTLLFDPALTSTEYVVIDALTGNEFDLGYLGWTPFASASGNYPPVNGDTLTVDAPSGSVTVVVQSSQSYDFYYGSNPLTGEIIDMGRDEFLLGVSWDTLLVQDPYQSWFMVSTGANGGELWGTRDALRLSVLNPQWVRFAENLGTSQVDVEFSEDLSHIYVLGNNIYRFDGLGSVYTSDDDFDNKLDLDSDSSGYAITRTTVSTLNFSAIGIDPRNPDDLVAVQGFNGNVYRSSNATAVSPSLTNVGSQGGLAFYDVVVDRDDNQILFAATSNGVSLSENGGATWTDVSDDGFAGTPAYHILQSWRTWEEGNRRNGEVYVGTYGRGIWSTDAVLSLVNNDGNLKNDNQLTLKIYPNPTKDYGTLVFDLEGNNSNVKIDFYNISGRLVKSIKASASTGKNEIGFSTSGMPQGTYIVRLKSGDFVQSTKFIKL